MQSRKNILITGSASGIGAAVRERMLSLGHRVIGVDIKPTDGLGADSYVADITDREAIDKIAEKLTEDGVTLDVIINAAGVHAMCSLVEGDIDRMKRLIDVNLVGTMTVNRLLYPRLKTDGRIVIVTSEVAPLDPMPFNGLYNVSKTALDCYAQALRQELGLLGQSVVTVRPGAVETPLARGSLDATEALANETVLYERQAGKFLRITRRFMGTPISPERLAKVIERAALSRHPRLIYSKHRSPGLLLLSILPKRMQCGIIKWLLCRK